MTNIKLSDRGRVNQAIDYRAMSTMVTVSEEFVEEMRDCVPPTFMGHVYPFNYIQVGEIAEHSHDGTPLYETYCTVSEEGVNSWVTNRYDFGQWYFIGLKPQINHG